MHTIHIRIGGDDYLIVSQVIQILFNVEGMLEQIEFFIFINHLFGQTETI